MLTPPPRGKDPRGHTHVVPQSRESPETLGSKLCSNKGGPGSCRRMCSARLDTPKGCEGHLHTLRYPGMVSGRQNQRGAWRGVPSTEAEWGGAPWGGPWGSPRFPQCQGNPQHLHFRSPTAQTSLPWTLEGSQDQLSHANPAGSTCLLPWTVCLGTQARDRRHLPRAIQGHFQDEAICPSVEDRAQEGEGVTQEPQAWSPSRSFPATEQIRGRGNGPGGAPEGEQHLFSFSLHY